MHSLVIRQIQAANFAAEQLEEQALISGAMPGEFKIIWKFVRGYGGLWPFLV